MGGDLEEAMVVVAVMAVAVSAGSPAMVRRLSSMIVDTKEYHNLNTVLRNNVQSGRGIGGRGGAGETTGRGDVRCRWGCDLPTDGRSQEVGFPNARYSKVACSAPVSLLVLWNRMPVLGRSVEVFLILPHLEAALRTSARHQLTQWLFERHKLGC